MKWFFYVFLIFVVTACSDDGLVQYRDGHPVGTPADKMYEDYWAKLEKTSYVRRPKIQPIDREVLMTQVIGKWVPDYRLSKITLPKGEYIDIRSDGTVCNAAGKVVGQWDMRKGRVDVWSQGTYRYSIIKVRGRICHLVPSELNGFAPLLPVK